MPAIIPAIAAVVGTVVSGVGAITQYNAAKDAAENQQHVIEEEKKAEAQRQQAMELDAQRRQREQLRQQTIARSNALAAATADGAQYGSGLQGAYGGISGAVNTNTLGINQNLEIGRNIFAIDNTISGYRENIAGDQSQMAFGSMLGNFGHGIVTLGPALNRVGTTFSQGSPFGRF